MLSLTPLVSPHPLEDVSKQTTQDYSVEMLNPPPNCFDLQKYFDFFSVHGEVVYICLTVRNGTLLRKLADRVILKERLRGLGLRPRWKNRLPPSLASACMVPREEKMREDLRRLEEEIRDICSENKPRFRPYRVFAIYNTEQSKRDCIDGKKISYLEFLTGQTTRPLAKFEGQLVRVVEPGEPSDILYDFTDATLYRRVLSWILSFLICAVFIIVSFFIVQAIQASGSAEVNIVLPIYWSDAGIGSGHLPCCEQLHPPFHHILLYASSGAPHSGVAATAVYSAEAVYHALH